MASLDEALDLAFELYAAGRHAETAELCRRILAAVPGHPAAAQAAGAALAALGRRRESAAAFRLLLAQAPAAAAGWSNLANVAELDDAATAHQRASICDPMLADAWANQAARLIALNRRDGAAAAARSGLQADPAHVAAMANLADAQTNGAARLRWAARAARLAPAMASARQGWAAALGASGRLAAAAGAAKVAAALDPALVLAWEALALTAIKLDDLPTSDAALARAAALDPDGTAKTAVSVHLAAARPEQALACADSALRRAPTDEGLHWNRATALLQAGRWAEGWAAFERRRADDRAEPPWRNLGVPTWDGGRFPGRRLLLYAEQGLGDALQMLRFVPLAAALGGEVILEVQPPLVGLARRVVGPKTVVARGDAPPPFDLECPLMSLPGKFGATPERMPGEAACLRPDPARVARWRERLALTAKPKVGLVWAGNPRFPDDARRSPGLAALRPLLTANPQVCFVILQMGEGRRDLARVALPADAIDLGAEIADLDDTLAIMTQLDLMISSCTLPAHVAAAAGTPLWLLLSFAPDWRWLLGREDTPWHPKARLFRQPRPGDWAEPAARMARELADLADAGCHPSFA